MREPRTIAQKVWRLATLAWAIGAMGAFAVLEDRAATVPRWRVPIQIAFNAGLAMAWPLVDVANHTVELYAGIFTTPPAPTPIKARDI